MSFTTISTIVGQGVPSVMPVFVVPESANDALLRWQSTFGAHRPTATNFRERMPLDNPNFCVFPTRQLEDNPETAVGRLHACGLGAKLGMLGATILRTCAHEMAATPKATAGASVLRRVGSMAGVSKSAPGARMHTIQRKLEARLAATALPTGVLARAYIFGKGDGSPLNGFAALQCVVIEVLPTSPLFAGAPPAGGVPTALPAYTPQAAAASMHAPPPTYQPQAAGAGTGADYPEMYPTLPAYPQQGQEAPYLTVGAAAAAAPAPSAAAMEKDREALGLPSYRESLAAAAAQETKTKGGQ